MSADVKPQDVASTRRELVEWLTTRGAPYYAQMILIGRQPVRPPGPAALVGASLAHEEQRRVTQADLWYLDEDLCDLLAASHATMPRFAPQPSDLPSARGFVMFGRTLVDRDPQDERDLGAFMDLMETPTHLREVIGTAPVEIVGASWGPCPYRDPEKAPAGALWVTFYSRSRLHGVADETARRAVAGLPDLMPDNEAVIPWCPDGADPEQWLLPTPDPDADSTWSWASLLFAAFRLAGQGNLAEQSTERPPRPERRRAERAGLPERDVRVVRLRRGVSGGGGDGSGREYRHRWVVRGHWRQQPWGPGRAFRRPVYVLPHVKGPEGAPLLGGERVTVVGAPSPASEEPAAVT